MKTMNDAQLNEVVGGGDSLAKDLGQFVGGVSGWMQSNLGVYLLLGPGFGGIFAIKAGLEEAAL